MEVNMGKFTPSITIWSVGFINDDGICYHNVYFLFYKSAKKYSERKSNEDFRVCLGGEPLYLW